MCYVVWYSDVVLCDVVLCDVLWYVMQCGVCRYVMYYVMWCCVMQCDVCCYVMYDVMWCYVMQSDVCRCGVK